MIVCPRCRAQNHPKNPYCFYCGFPFAQPAQYTPAPVQQVYQPPQQPAVNANQLILQQVIAHFTQRGYRVVSQTDTTVQLVREKSFSCLTAVILMLLFVIPFLMYMIWYHAKKDDRLYIVVNPDSSISFTYNDNKPIRKMWKNGDTEQLDEEYKLPQLMTWIAIGAVIILIILAAFR